MITELTEVQRTALGDCIAYLLERLRQQKAAAASQNPRMHNPLMAAEQGSVPKFRRVLEAGSKKPRLHPNGH
jgi:hypothetical protein